MPHTKSLHTNIIHLYTFLRVFTFTSYNHMPDNVGRPSAFPFTNAHRMKPTTQPHHKWDGGSHYDDQTTLQIWLLISINAYRIIYHSAGCPCASQAVPMSGCIHFLGGAPTPLHRFSLTFFDGCQSWDAFLFLEQVS